MFPFLSALFLLCSIECDYHCKSRFANEYCATCKYILVPLFSKHSAHCFHATLYAGPPLALPLLLFFSHHPDETTTRFILCIRCAGRMGCVFWCYKCTTFQHCFSKIQMLAMFSVLVVGQLYIRFKCEQDRTASSRPHYRHSNGTHYRRYLSLHFWLAPL